MLWRRVMTESGRFVRTLQIPTLPAATRSEVGVDLLRADLTPAALVECVLESVPKFSAEAEQHDDVTVLALRYKGR